MRISRLLPTSLGAVTLALALAAAPQSANAFGVSGVGGKLGVASPEDRDGTAMMGVHAELEESGTRLHMLPNLMYWQTDGLRDVSPNFDVYYHFRREGRTTPYLGGGLGLNFMSNTRTDNDETDLGVNAIAGLRFPGESNHYFLEGRYTASDLPQIAVLGGVTFGMR